ncbi:L,D-transpeptidase family protein [Tabrizicola oligotrophica]|uniref:L,D-transpeptidase family protein n=1 Tax=Tabrizicola oligotrophica TaxID=2710650 RepID=A0A6M0QUJ1_9RHOB|nr:L,D-transpeptidase family protein [Tabrizicola oligotrophica]NEY91095.1 L,D-transpeptidase family protein [Tabrizicola oligotrophica]
MAFLRVLLLIAIGFGVTACGSKFRTYRGPEVTQVLVSKSDRKMYLFHNDKVLKEYDIGLGFAPEGHKQFEGDGKTPEGNYTISHRNPKSEFHLSLGISYPNDADRAFAAENGKPPGGDIFIHGGPNRKVTKQDWTAGCIAVTDRQMEMVYAMVKPGTPVQIQP